MQETVASAHAELPVVFKAVIGEVEIGSTLFGGAIPMTMSTELPWQVRQLIYDKVLDKGMRRDEEDIFDGQRHVLFRPSQARPPKGAPRNCVVSGVEEALHERCALHANEHDRAEEEDLEIELIGARLH